MLRVVPGTLGMMRWKRSPEMQALKSASLPLCAGFLIRTIARAQNNPARQSYEVWFAHNVIKSQRG